MEEQRFTFFLSISWLLLSPNIALSLVYIFIFLSFVFVLNCSFHIEIYNLFFDVFTTIFVVGNIPYDATEEQLKEICREVGPVISFR